ncbi:MAG: DUF4890 domain-containing protein [Bacteroidales bacterium]|jgi:hypothetical protein|nr:DUF4890 domain-containing protein [Bacteroidales bacterium]
MGNNLHMTKSQRTARLDYEMSMAVSNLSERQQRRIHRLNKKYVDAIGNRISAKTGRSGNIGNMGAGIGQRSHKGVGSPVVGQMDGKHIHQNGSRPQIASKTGPNYNHDMTQMSNNKNFETIEKVRAARETYDNAVKKVLDNEQFEQYKAYEKHKIMMMTNHNRNGNKPHMMNESGMVKRMDINIARAVKSLSDSQIKAIHELNSVFVANREKTRGQIKQDGNAGKSNMHAQMSEIRKNYETSLKNILTSEQYQQYESFGKHQRMHKQGNCSTKGKLQETNNEK